MAHALFEYLELHLNQKKIWLVNNCCQNHKVFQYLYTKEEKDMQILLKEAQ